MTKTIKPSRETIVETEHSVREGILRGLADVEAGRVVPHNVAMRHLRKVIAEGRSNGTTLPPSGLRTK